MKQKAPGWMQTADVVVHVQRIFCFLRWTASSEEKEGKVKMPMTESNQSH